MYFNEIFGKNVTYDDIKNIYIPRVKTRIH